MKCALAIAVLFAAALAAAPAPAAADDCAVCTSAMHQLVLGERAMRRVCHAGDTACLSQYSKIMSFHYTNDKKLISDKLVCVPRESRAIKTCPLEARCAMVGACEASPQHVGIDEAYLSDSAVAPVSQEEGGLTHEHTCEVCSRVVGGILGGTAKTVEEACPMTLSEAKLEMCKKAFSEAAANPKVVDKTLDCRQGGVKGVAAAGSPEEMCPIAARCSFFEPSFCHRPEGAKALRHSSTKAEREHAAKLAEAHKISSFEISAADKCQVCVAFLGKGVGKSSVNTEAACRDVLGAHFDGTSVEAKAMQRLCAAVGSKVSQLYPSQRSPLLKEDLKCYDDMILQYSRALNKPSASDNCALHSRCAFREVGFCPRDVFAYRSIGETLKHL